MTVGLVILALLGCAEPAIVDTGAGDAGQPVGTCGPEGGYQHWAIDSLVFARVDGDVSAGFDLDDQVSTSGGATGCGIGDLVSPDGTPGIDNAFGRLLPVLDNTEFAAAEPLIAATIATGELLLIPEVSGLDDPWSDDCVTPAIRRGYETPMLGADGSMLAGQTLDLDPDFDDQIFDPAPVVNGSVEGRPLEVSLPLQVLDAALEFRLMGGAIRYELQDDMHLTGVFAGGLDTQSLRELSQGTGLDDGLEALIDSLLDSAADLAPDETGQCTQLSVAFEFTAVPIHVFADAL